MANEYTAERLMRWGSDCNREGNGALGLALVEYAEAWEQERDELRAENERLKAEIENHKWDTWSLGECGELSDDWITHDSTEPPTDLAPAQLVELQAPTTGGVFAVRRVDDLPWHPGLRYRPALSASGLPLCSAEGLKPEATHVFTPSSGFPAQCPDKPEYRSDGLWFASGWSYAPSTHRRPGPASESLMEVWRD